MTPVLKLLLVSHVIFGVFGIAGFYAVWMGLLKKELAVIFLMRTTWFSSLMIWASWFTGGYYYWNYYGQAVKDVIKGGQYPWAHTVVMEAKEHVFLFLPFLSIVLAVLVTMYSQKLADWSALRLQLARLSAVATILGILITLSGVVISGAVR